MKKFNGIAVFAAAMVMLFGVFTPVKAAEFDLRTLISVDDDHEFIGESGNYDNVITIQRWDPRYKKKGR